MKAVVCVLTMGVSVNAATHYVWQGSPHPTPPYASWETAAHVIQDAVDAAADGDMVVVTNGVYATGGRAMHGTLTNRVAVDKPLHLKSVNGPEVTIIKGYQVPGTTNGNGAIRCVYLASGASLSGLTLTNGATQTSGDQNRREGGGLWCESTSSLVTNCLLKGNSAGFAGGGSSYGTLNHCTLAGNSAELTGGGSYSGTLNNCTLTSNSALYGGGSYDCTLNNCTVSGNSAGWGGGSASGSLNNCTLTGNSALHHGGGSDFCGLHNCILYYNSATVSDDNYAFSVLTNCCTTPLPGSGTGNITNTPLFVETNAWSNLRLQSNSPCINAGNNDFVSTPTDLDGNPRIGDGVVDMGAYEFVPPTPAELVEQLIDLINASDLQHKQPLLVTLNAALASIERDNCHSAVGQLHSFQNKVGAQVSDADLAAERIASVGEVIAALDCGGAPRVAAKIHSLERQPNGKMHVQIKGEAGKAYILEASTNLVDWKPICVLSPHEDGECEFEDSEASHLPCRFYRLKTP